MANGPFSGVTTWQGVNALLSSGTIDPATAALIIGDMQANGTGGVNNSGSGWNSSSALPSGMPLPSGNEISPIAITSPFGTDYPQPAPNTTVPAATQATNAAKSAAGGLLSGITGKLGDWTLIAFGAIMILGALMISQKQTVIELAKSGVA